MYKKEPNKSNAVSYTIVFTGLVRRITQHLSTGRSYLPFENSPYSGEALKNFERNFLKLVFVNGIHEFKDILNEKPISKLIKLSLQIR